MRKLVYLARARQDLGDIIDWMLDAGASIEAARGFRVKLDQHCVSIAESAVTMGRPRDEFGLQLRSVVFGSYLIFLRYSDDSVEIVRIVHGARDLRALFQGKSELE